MWPCWHLALLLWDAWAEERDHGTWDVRAYWRSGHQRTDLTIEYYCRYCKFGSYMVPQVLYDSHNLGYPNCDSPTNGFFNLWFSEGGSGSHMVSESSSSSSTQRSGRKDRTMHPAGCTPTWKGVQAHHSTPVDGSPYV